MIRPSPMISAKSRRLSCCDTIRRRGLGARKLSRRVRSGPSGRPVRSGNTLRDRAVDLDGHVAEELNDPRHVVKGGMQPLEARFRFGNEMGRFGALMIRDKERRRILDLEMTGIPPACGRSRT